MQISSYENITPENIKFQEDKDCNVKGSKINYKRIPIECIYGKKKKGQLLVETPFLFSFGISKNFDKSNKLTGYSLPICLWSKDTNPTDKEKAFFDTINLLVDLSQKHLEKEYGPDVVLSSPLYYKKVEYTDKKGKKRTKIDDTSAPVLYPKIIYSEKSKKFITLFNNKKGSIDPQKYIDYNCRVKLAILIEGIFISETTTSLQIKVYECYIRDLEPRKSLMTVEESDEEDE